MNQSIRDEIEQLDREWFEELNDYRVHTRHDRHGGSHSEPEFVGMVSYWRATATLLVAGAVFWGGFALDGEHRLPLLAVGTIIAGTAALQFWKAAKFHRRRAEYRRRRRELVEQLESTSSG